MMVDRVLRKSANSSRHPSETGIHLETEVREPCITTNCEFVETYLKSWYTTQDDFRVIQSQTRL